MVNIIGQMSNFRIIRNTLFYKKCLFTDSAWNYCRCCNLRGHNSGFTDRHSLNAGRNNKKTNNKGKKMLNLITKTKILLKENKQKEFFDTLKAYIRYIFLSAWFKISLKETNPELKKVNKNWIIYTYLKTKYSSFLKKYKTKENNSHEYSDIVWWCWFQGEEKAPDIVKACLESVRRNMPDKKINIITESNMWDYVSMPDFIKEKYKKGIISRTHFSDLLRLELLITYGGTWIDSTVLCTAEPNYAFNTPLFAFKTNEKNDPATAAQNWFM